MTPDRAELLKIRSMARLPNTIRWRDFSAGNAQKISSDINIPNSVPFSMNLLFDRVLGEAESRQ